MISNISYRRLIFNLFQLYMHLNLPEAEVSLCSTEFRSLEVLYGCYCSNHYDTKYYKLYYGILSAISF